MRRRISRRSCGRSQARFFPRPASAWTAGSWPPRSCAPWTRCTPRGSGITACIWRRTAHAASPRAGRCGFYATAGSGAPMPRRSPMISACSCAMTTARARRSRAARSPSAACSAMLKGEHAASPPVCPGGDAAWFYAFFSTVSGMPVTSEMTEAITRICGVMTLSRWCTSWRLCSIWQSATGRITTLPASASWRAV